MQPVIVTKQLTRSFGNVSALRGVDLEVPAGSIYGFLGPNGSGKTTTIRLLLGLLRPDKGEIRIFGKPMPHRRIEIARSMGALVEMPCHYDHLTGRENLEISRRLLGLRASAIDRALDIVSLGYAARQKVHGYSLGMQQRLGIARALLADPKLLLLDEPTNGLDPDGIRDIRELIKSLPEQAGITVFISSHLLSEVEQMASHVGLMLNGELLSQGPLVDILAKSQNRLAIATDRTNDAAALLRQAGFGVETNAKSNLVIASDQPIDAAAINHMLMMSGMEVSALIPQQPTLEELYMQLTSNKKG